MWFHVQPGELKITNKAVNYIAKRLIKIKREKLAFTLNVTFNPEIMGFLPIKRNRIVKIIMMYRNTMHLVHGFNAVT